MCTILRCFPNQGCSKVRHDRWEESSMILCISISKYFQNTFWRWTVCLSSHQWCVGAPQCKAVTQLCPTVSPRPACQAPLSISNSQSLLRLVSIKSVMPFNHLFLCQPLLLPSVFPSVRVFSNESVLHIKWPKDWSFSFSISPSSEYSGPISFRMDWYERYIKPIWEKSQNTPERLSIYLSK